MDGIEKPLYVSEVLEVMGVRLKGAAIFFEDAPNDCGDHMQTTENGGAHPGRNGKVETNATKSIGHSRAD